MILKSYTNKWHQVPHAVKQFLLKGLFLLLIWKVIYIGFLLPGRILDAPLTYTVGILTTDGLNWITHSNSYWSKSELGEDQDADLKVIWVKQQSVYFQHYKLVGVYDGCNALELFLLYNGFIVCMPASLKRKLVFAGAGTVLIFIINILRCIGIAYIIQYYPKQAEFAHHFVFVSIVYALIVALWLIFANNIKVKPDAKNKQGHIILGLIAIVTVYCFYNLFLAYASYVNSIPRKLRHINRLLCIIVIYSIGFYTFKKNSEKWVTETWKIIYFSILALLILIGTYDWIWGPSALALRSFAKTLNEFLISPLPYVALLAISKNMDRGQFSK